MKKLVNILFNHERYETIAFLVCGLLLLMLWGCPEKAPSLLDPGRNVSRAELENELQLMLVKAEQGFARMDQIRAIKKAIFDQAIVSAQTGVINPIGLMTGIGAILGLGATIDNVRKRKEIKSLTKTKTPSE